MRWLKPEDYAFHLMEVSSLKTCEPSYVVSVADALKQLALNKPTVEDFTVRYLSDLKVGAVVNIYTFTEMCNASCKDSPVNTLKLRGIFQRSGIMKWQGSRPKGVSLWERIEGTQFLF